MRTKILLSAIAALAVGVATSMAQTTYSQNIVGYANVPTTSSGANYLITCPFTMGVSNGINEVFGANLPVYSTVLTWNFGNQGYDTFIYDPSGSPSGWDDGNYTALDALPTLPVGTGFFLIPSGAVTNTFAGTIPVNVGTSNKVNLATSGANYLVGCMVPYAGYVTNGNNSTGGPNLGPNNGTPDYTTLLIWNFGNQGYDTYISDPASTTSGWDDGNYTALDTPPSISVGQGFFIIPSGGFNWTVGL